MTEKEYLKQLGEKISAKREALGLSKEGLSKSIDISRMHLYRIEKGEHSPSITILRRIAQELEVSLPTLVK